MNHCENPHCTCSNASFLDVRKRNAKFQFKKSIVITTRAPGSRLSRAFPVEYYKKNVQNLVFAEVAVS